MDVGLVYFLVILFDIFVWVSTTHTYTLIHFLEDAIIFDRRLLRNLSTSRLKSVAKRMEDLLLEDDRNINGFNPPRALQLAVAFTITVENVLVTVIPWSGETISARSMALQSGRLCYINMLPLCLLVIPDNGIFSSILKQCREQWLWAHSFFGWLIISHGTVHAVASLSLVSNTPGPETSSWTTGSTAGVLLLTVALSSKLRRKSTYSFSNPFSCCFHSLGPNATFSWLDTHWILTSILCLLTISHVMLHLAWAFVLAVMAGVILLICTSLTQHTTYTSTVFRESMELAASPNTQIRVLEVDVSSPMTAGQSYYFKVGGIPIRAAWVRRDFIRTTKTLKYTAVLFLLVDTEASSELEACGPYIIPPSPLITTHNYLDIVTLDSGVVEAYQNLAWRYELTGQTKATSLTWFNESPDMLRAWLTYAGFGKHLCKRIICYGRSRDYIIASESIKKAFRLVSTNEELPKRRNKQRYVDTLAEAIHSGVIQLSEDVIEHVLQDFIPGSKNLHVIGENLRSYGISTKRLDSDEKVHESLEEVWDRLEKGYVRDKLMKGQDMG